MLAVTSYRKSIILITEYYPKVIRDPSFLLFFSGKCELGGTISTLCFSIQVYFSASLKLSCCQSGALRNHDKIKMMTALFFIHNSINYEQDLQYH